MSCHLPPPRPAPRPAPPPPKPVPVPAPVPAPLSPNPAPAPAPPEDDDAFYVTPDLQVLPCIHAPKGDPPPCCDGFHRARRSTPCRPDLLHLGRTFNTLELANQPTNLCVS
ncbi:alpha carbonic anhydrase 8-like [Gambusia affinis]|uniref:alpha carbonic anhydrase 8-like n=1 Tax=Gambusia affinis TaxID=33528 RepID=UPI001CDC718E|nr:alpha carbonic anhydrase 8-like [Gambusia affinis]